MVSKKNSEQRDDQPAYRVPCSTAFRDQVEEMAKRLKVNVADLAQAVVLTLPKDTVTAFPDPGGPEDGESETFVLQFGAARGLKRRREPYLRIKVPPEGYHAHTIRRALNLALAFKQGKLVTRMDERKPGVNGRSGRDRAEFRQTLEEMDQLRAVVSVLSFDLLPGGVRNREEALYVLGFPPRSTPAIRAIQGRFRMLATIHHPDSGYGSHERMAQVNSAMEILTGKRKSA